MEKCVRGSGRTLKQIIDSTGCSIQIPRDEDLPLSSSEPTAQSVDSDSEDLGPLISISLSGPSSAVASAKLQILAIVRERTSKTTVSIPEIPSEYWIFLRAKVDELVEKTLEEEKGETKENVTVFVPRRVPAGGKRGVDVEDSGANEENGDKGEKSVVKVMGEKELVKRVVQAIHEEVNELVRPPLSLLSLSLSLEGVLMR